MIRALIQGSAAEHPLGIGGVTLVDVNRDTLTKLLATLVLIIVVALRGTGSGRGCSIDSRTTGSSRHSGSSLKPIARER